MRLRVDPIWLARVEESARNFAKACGDFKKGVKEGLQNERDRKLKEAMEKDHRARIEATRRAKEYNPEEADKLQKYWGVRCVDCGLKFHLSLKCLASGPSDGKEAAKQYLLDRGWVPRGSGRWVDSLRCFGCARLARSGD